MERHNNAHQHIGNRHHQLFHIMVTTQGDIIGTFLTNQEK